MKQGHFYYPSQSLGYFRNYIYIEKISGDNVKYLEISQSSKYGPAYLISKTVNKESLLMVIYNNGSTSSVKSLTEIKIDYIREFLVDIIENNQEIKAL